MPVAISLHFMHMTNRGLQNPCCIPTTLISRNMWLVNSGIDPSHPSNGINNNTGGIKSGELLQTNLLVNALPREVLVEEEFMVVVCINDIERIWMGGMEKKKGVRELKWLVWDWIIWIGACMICVGIRRSLVCLVWKCGGECSCDWRPGCLSLFSPQVARNGNVCEEQEAR